MKKQPLGSIAECSLLHTLIVLAPFYAAGVLYLGRKEGQHVSRLRLVCGLLCAVIRKVPILMEFPPSVEFCLLMHPNTYDGFSSWMLLVGSVGNSIRMGA